MPDVDELSSAGSNHRVCAFDFGLKHIGVAVGQSLLRTAEPIAVIKAKQGSPSWDEIGQLLEQWRPDFLLVGLPLNMDGSESEMSARARKFAKRLHGRYGLKVELCDERLSSFEAKSIRHERQDDRRQALTVDAEAAQLILESWFNRE